MTLAGPRRSSVLVWVLLSVVLAPGSVLSSILATVLLEAVVTGPVPASLATMFPGYVYGSATIMKVGLLSCLLTLIAAAAAWLRPRGGPGSVPVCALAAVALPSAAPIAGAAVIAVAQVVIGSPSLTDFTYMSRRAVVVQLSLIVLGAAAAVLALIRRERPPAAPALGLLVNGLLIVLFWRLRFYAVGFDQDSWAPR